MVRNILCELMKPKTADTTANGFEQLKIGWARMMIFGIGRSVLNPREVAIIIVRDL